MLQVASNFKPISPEIRNEFLETEKSSRLAVTLVCRCVCVCDDCVCVCVCVCDCVCVRPEHSR